MQEIISLRKEISKTFDLGGGKKQLVIQNGLHYQDIDGSFKDCDTTIVQSSTENGFNYSCEAIQLPFHISSTGKRRIFLARDKSKFIDLNLPNLGILGTPVITGNKITWDKANFTLNLFAVPEGTKLEVVLKQKLASNTFNFPLSKTGITLTELQKYLSKPWAKDANNKNVPITYTKTDTGLEITIDDTGKTYPITIDPQVTKQPSAADAGLIAEVNVDTNFGSNTALTIGRLDGSGGFFRWVISWDFSADIAAGSTIDAATASLYCYAVDGVGESFTFSRVLRTDWNESQVTWNSYKTSNLWTTAGCGSDGNDFTSTNQASSTRPAAGNWQDWSVQALTQTALDSVGGVLHATIRGPETTDVRYGNYYTKEETVNTTLRPKLVIDYTEGGTASNLIMVN